MTKHHKDQANGAHQKVGDSHPKEEDKLFNFDKTSGEETQVKNDPELAAVDEKITELETTISELKDKHLRLLAEFDNYKKRTMRERLELMNSASRDVIQSLLPVLDDFDRAKKSADDPNTDEVFSEGVTLVYNRLYNTLQNLGLKTMVSTGQPFDPEQHEAITEIPSPDESLKGKVIDTLENGYLLNDKIIRHAKVVVGN